MIYAFDTYYFDSCARTACLGFTSWQAEAPDFEQIEIRKEVAAYESGAFYKRELPCITSIVDTLTLDGAEDILVVDGFVVLDDEGKLGLGGYLYEYLNRKIPVIGVAKNDFVRLKKEKRAVLRGESIKPLFITAKGINLDQAAEHIQSMHGEYRFPSLFKLVDQKSRGQ